MCVRKELRRKEKKRASLTKKKAVGCVVVDVAVRRRAMSVTMSKRREVVTLSHY